METDTNTIKLYYNTEREKLQMPEYGRIVLSMVEQLKEIPDREKRSSQAKAVVKVMETLNPQVHTQDNYAHKLWDHLYMMAGYDLDIDAPFPAPAPEERSARPMVIPIEKNPIRYNHYGRNIESIIDLIASEPEGEVKQALLRSLATYMRQQYLIWNKDNVAEETIFADIERLSDGKLKVPEDVHLGAIAQNANFSRPGISVGTQNAGGNFGGGGKKNRNWKRKK